MSKSTTRLSLYATHFQPNNNTRKMSTPAASKFFAIVAGVGAGTGRSVALKFASTYPVVLLARNPANYTFIVEEIQANGQKALGIQTDISDPASVKKAFEEIAAHEEFGKGRKLAAAVYNAGGGARKPFLELKLDELEQGWGSNG